jgi:hypothetical protein
MEGQIIQWPEGKETAIHDHSQIFSKKAENDIEI